MDTAGLVMMLVGIYLLTSAIKNRRPVDTVKAVIANPAKAKEVVTGADGYEAESTGPPRLSWSTGGNETGNDSGEQSDDPTMAIGALSLADGGTRPPNVPAGVAAGVKPVTRKGLYSVARAFPQLKSFGGRGGRPGNWSDHPKGLAIDVMIPGWNSDSGKTLGNQVAAYFQKNASALSVKYIIWNRQKWNPAASSAWRPYTHPSGVHTATLDHRDHVHISFKG